MIVKARAFFLASVFLVIKQSESDKHNAPVVPLVGHRARWEEPGPDPPEGERLQPGAGRGAAEGSLHGRGQGQEAGAPAGPRDRERVS